MNDIATDFKESARIDVNDVLNDMQEDIQMVASDVEDINQEICNLIQTNSELSLQIIELINKLDKQEREIRALWGKV